MTIRPATLADCEAVAGIYAESLAAGDASMETETSPAAFRAMLEGFHDREALLVLEDGGSMLGWGVVKRYSDRPGYRVACETSIYLRRDRLGRGLGRRLQEALFERCRAFGYHHVVAKIWASNERSLEFHRRLGFEMVGIQREIGLVDGRRQDVAIMQRILD